MVIISIRPTKSIPSHDIVCRYEDTYNICYILNNSKDVYYFRVSYEGAFISSSEFGYGINHWDKWVKNLYPKEL